MAEEKKITFGKIGNALKSVATDHIVTVAGDVFDEERQKYQSEVNTDIEEKIGAESGARDLAINAEAQVRTQNDQLLSQAIAAEQERAEAAEQANATEINAAVTKNEEQDQKLSELEIEVGQEDVLIDFNVEPSATFISDVDIIGGKEYTIKVDENNGASVMLLLNVSDYVRINSGTTVKHTFAGSGRLQVYNSISSVISGTVLVYGIGIVSKLQKLSLSITDLSNEISYIKEDVDGINGVLIGSSHTYDNADDFAGKGYIDSNGALQEGGKNGTFELKVGDAVHGKINVSSAMYLARVNDDGTYTPVLRATTGSFGWYEFDYKAPDNMTLLVPTWTMGSGEDAAYVTISNKPKYTYTELQNEVESLIEDGMQRVYVDGTNGNDSNDGSLSFPLKSLVAALAKGNDIVMLTGEYTYPDETLFKMDGKKFSLKGKRGASVIIRCGSNLGKPTKNSNQYEINAPADVTSWANSTFDRFPLYIDGLKDKEIPTDELHPCQKGHTHRLPSKRLYKVGDSRADEYTWEYTNGKIVINAPVDITSYDIWRPVYGIDQRCRNSVIELENFELRYNSLGLTNSHCVAKDISILHSCNNEFGLQYNYSYLYAERVEVGGTAMKRSSALDGIYYNMCDSFQGHGGGSAYASRNGASAILIDCWAHDSDDDTCSDHGSWDTTIIGGLYEYANKGCIMPSNGQRCKVIGATARKGRYGFVSCNQVDGKPLLDDVKQGMYLVSCVAEKCTETGYCSYSKRAVMYLVNCLSKNNYIGYKNKSDDYADEGTMILENCKSFGDTTKSYGTITKNNYQDL